MFDYAIGDIQGCFDALQRLLDHIQFNDRVDRLWFVGDLVNRGPQSLEVLRFLKKLPRAPIITLGNHDLHLLSRIFGQHPPRNASDTLEAILLAPDRDELGHWLRQQAIIHYDEGLNVVMSHAGLPPIWTLDEAIQFGQELEAVLSGDDYHRFLSHMYGNVPHEWSPTHTDLIRWRVICNYFTRMRFCDAAGGLTFKEKGQLIQTPKGYYPWFNAPHRKPIHADIIFGHWASLKGQCPVPGIYALDTGCQWGGRLTALRLQDRQLFSVHGL